MSLQSNPWRAHFAEVSKREKARRRPRVSVDEMTVEFGAESASVLAQVQQKLNELGASPPLVVDGNWGPKSATQLRALQTANGLTADGVVGPAILSFLGLKVNPGTVSDHPLSSVASWFTTTVAAAIAGLHQSVVNAFTSFTTHFEGYTDFPYTDSKSFVTTGIGNLMEDLRTNQPTSEYLSLPWTIDGRPATRQEIVDGWWAVKHAWPGVQSRASQSITRLRLSKEGVAKILTSKMNGNHAYLKTRYPGYVNWPADAQLAMHSISWAWGPAFHTKWGQNGVDFLSAVNRPKPDFRAAATLLKEASVNEEKRNPGIITRNAATVQLFENAASAQDKGADYSQLYFPNVVTLVTAAGIGVLGVAATIGGGFLAVLGLRHLRESGGKWGI